METLRAFERVWYEGTRTALLGCGPKQDLVVKTDGVRYLIYDYKRMESVNIPRWVALAIARAAVERARK